MEDENKTKKQLLNELVELRQRITELEKSEIERKQVEEELYESKERFRNLVEITSDWVWEVDENAVYTYVSPKVRDILGYEPDEVLGKTPFDFMPHDEAIRVAAIFGSMADQNKPFNSLENTNLHKDGHLVVLETSGVPLFDSNGTFRAYRGIDRSITDRKQSEEQAKQLQEYLQLQIERMPIGLIVWDTEFRVQSWNPAAENIFGFTAEEVLGKHPYDLIVPKETQPRVDTIWNRLLEGDTEAYSDSENENITKDGRNIICKWTNTAFKKTDGTILGVLSMVEDITELKQAQEGQARLLKRFETLWEITSKVDADIQTLCDYILLKIMEITESAYAFYGFLNEDESVVTVYSWSKTVMEECNVQDKPLRFPIASAGLWANAIRERRTLIVNNYQAEHPCKNWLPKCHVPIERIMVIPIFRHGRIVTIAAVANKIVDYTEKDDRQIEMLATNAQIILERRHAEEGLRKSEEKYRTLTESFNEVIYRADPETFISTYINKAVENLYGYSVEQWLKDADLWVNTIHPDDKERVLAEFEGAKRKNEDGKSVYRIISKDRLTKWVKDNFIWENDGQGNVISLNGIVYDITEHKMAEEALRESEEKYRNLYESSIDGITTSDTKGRLLEANKSFLDMVGYTLEEYRKFTYQQLTPQKWHEMEAAIVNNQVMVHGYSDIYEKEYIRKDGSIFPAAVRAHLTKDKQGKPIGMWGLVRDITRRKKVDEQIKRQIERITALRNIDMAITSSLDVRVTLQVFLDQLTNVLRVDAASVLLLNPNTLNLEYAASRGFRTSALQHTKLSLGEGHAGRAALEHSVVSIPNLAEESFSRSKLIANEEFVSYYAMPLITKGNVKGILEIFHRAPLDPSKEWLDFLEALTAQAAIAIDNASLFDNLQRSNIDLILAYDATIEGWSRALDYRDKETEGHSQRVTEITVKMASAMGMSDKELVHVRRGALLHDIGKLGVPDAVLFKPRKLDDEEWEIMRKHPVFAYELLSPIAFLRPALDIPYCHHEKWDGTGYPRGLKGEQIPLAARIFAVVDVWDALSSDRPYRPAWSEDRIMKYLREQAGKHFDPQAVEIFLKFLSEQ